MAKEVKHENKVKIRMMICEWSPRKKKNSSFLENTYLVFDPVLGFSPNDLAIWTPWENSSKSYRPKHMDNQ